MVLLHVQLVCWKNIDKHQRIIRRRVRIVAIADCYSPFRLTFELLPDLPHLCCCSLSLCRVLLFMSSRLLTEDELRSLFLRFPSFSLSLSHFFRKIKSNTCPISLPLYNNNKNNNDCVCGNRNRKNPDDFCSVPPNVPIAETLFSSVCTRIGPGWSSR